jgi:hypothetical protein
MFRVITALGEGLVLVPAQVSFLVELLSGIPPTTRIHL